VAFFADYFVISTGTSDRMLNSLADALLEGVKAEARISGVKEGEASGGWIVVDFTDVVVHLFSPDQREYYQLEELWHQAKVLLRVQ